ncbi:probable membrane-associated kinase regulator 2 [Phragmites australis]|uniref:probable membrane-associated kinase regulator 2 n=1 Tax=Phragmites australis TaxID=29695 RepID=UPI002D77FF03|nr:probable membrane-associated kinase regulator 2 [Phragmites australis]
MESFSFLKYLRGGPVGGNQRAPVAATTIAATVCEDGGGGGGGSGDVDDDASFFDLEFAVPGDESAASDAEEERVEFNFAVAGDDVASGGGEVVAVDAVAPTGGESGDGKDDAELSAEVAPVPASTSLLRPATKFRVLLLKLRKPKVPVPGESNGGVGGAPAAKQANRFLIKFRVDDAPLVSLFTRDNSSRTSDAGAGADRPAAVQAAQPQDAAAAAAITAEERRFAKEVLLKYLNKIKPLYVKVSRRYGERLRFAGASEGEETDAEPDPAPSPAPSPSPSQLPSAAAPAPQPVVVACGVRAPRASVPAGLKQVCKRLGKSRSASSAVAAAPSPPPSATPQPQRRDDSLLLLQDGIQSAIAHCKRSFNASKGSESPLLLRPMTISDPRDGRAADTNDSGDGA